MAQRRRWPLMVGSLATMLVGGTAAAVKTDLNFAPPILVPLAALAIAAIAVVGIVAVVLANMQSVLADRSKSENLRSLVIAVRTPHPVTPELNAGRLLNSAAQSPAQVADVKEGDTPRPALPESRWRSLPPGRRRPD